MGQSCQGCCHNQQGEAALTLHDPGIIKSDADDAPFGGGRPAPNLLECEPECEPSSGQAAFPPPKPSEAGKLEAEGDPGLARREQDGPPAKRTGAAEAYAALEPAAARQLDALREEHRIFEAYELCPAFVEDRGCMQKFRSTVNFVFGQGRESWDGSLQGSLGDPGNGDRYTVQYRWGGATPEAQGTEFLWAKLCLDMNVPLWKAVGGWHEAEWQAKHDTNLTGCTMVGEDHPCHAIRCDLGGLAHQVLGKRQDYTEVFRYVNPETGFIVECNESVGHDDLVRRGHKLEPPKHKKGHDALIYLASWPRSQTQNTTVLYLRASVNFPRWIVNFAIRNFLSIILEKEWPKLLAKTDHDPELQAKFEEDRHGIHAFFRNHCERALAAGTGRYSAINLPPKELVLGRWAEPAAAGTP